MLFFALCREPSAGNAPSQKMTGKTFSFLFVWSLSLIFVLRYQSSFSSVILYKCFLTFFPFADVVSDEVSQRQNKPRRYVKNVCYAEHMLSA
jgi:hypothetical protein